MHEKITDIQKMLKLEKWFLDSGLHLCEAAVVIEDMIAVLKPIVGNTSEIVNAEECLASIEKLIGVEDDYGTEI